MDHALDKLLDAGWDYMVWTQEPEGKIFWWVNWLHNFKVKHVAGINRGTASPDPRG